MARNQIPEDDFADEFGPIKELSSQELRKDEFYQRFKRDDNKASSSSSTTTASRASKLIGRIFKPKPTKREGSKKKFDIRNLKIKNSKKYDLIRNIKITNSSKSPDPEKDNDPVPDAASTSDNEEIITNPDTIEVDHVPVSSIIDEISREHDIKFIKQQILSQLNGNFANLKDSSLFDKYADLYKILESTIRDKEGHSALIIGPRSCGKTSMANLAIAELREKYKDEFVAIRLNAMVHTADNVALREIAKQLDVKLKEVDVLDSDESNLFEQKSINETFANILETLDRDDTVKKSERLSIVFVIDEFEKFAMSHKQTLLYNLLDLAQNGKTPICVVGLSTKITARELLEKRVNSRFSQRVISIIHETSLEEFWRNARLGLILGETQIQALSEPTYGEEWNDKIEELYNAEDGILKKLVARNYYTIKDYRDFNISCRLAISRISTSQPYPNAQDFAVYPLHSMTNNVQGLIQSLSNLELLMVIAAARWIEKFELQTINFNLAYLEYKEMMKNFNVNITSSTSTESRLTNNLRINQKIWSEKVLGNCWENIYKMGLLLDSGGVTTNSEGHIINNVNLHKNLIIEENKMVQLDVTLDELRDSLQDSNIYKKLTQL
ncbi:ORC4 [[Candida] subhashii]|uniref:ORC4 n=1 Tax=[Candida] subhashii TaxID=561895 RepID=A0A8J5QFJ9_9ASCO|nr:ORC4 [[Candida] subhashii]KAG7664784.1 ORC4 [[Candida] subhashii]